jgi:CRISPR-associated protein Cmr6
MKIYNNLLNTLDNLKNPNYWSYVIIKSLDITKKKAEDKPYEEVKRTLLEYLVRNVKINEQVKGYLNTVKGALLANGFELREVRIEALYPVMIGGAETFGKLAFEIGLMFDPIFNVPYIPASTIKGAVYAALCELMSKEKSKEEAEKLCKEIFGDKESTSLVGFTDAYPIKVKEGENNHLLYPDVMTPHYSEETKDELAVEPNPIVYVTIAPGTEFKFYMFFKRSRAGKRIGIREIKNKISENPQPAEELLGIVDKALLYALIKGIGAKTALGYSKFKVVEYMSIQK